MIDFPDLHVSPGTRRGFSHDEPVTALLEALVGLERELAERLAQESRMRAEQRRENLTREIRRAFRPMARRLPEYDFFGQPRAALGGADDRRRAATRDRAGGAHPGAAGEPSEASEDVAPDEERTSRDPERRPGENGEAADNGHLFPPGPLAELRVRPRDLRLPPLATRALVARTLDADGRPCTGEVELRWDLDGPGSLDADGPRAVYAAPDLPAGDGPSICIRLRADQGGITLEREVPVRLAEPTERSRDDGIPEPHPVSAPGEPWRSRWRDGRWEYNDAHRDYLAIRDVEARRLRYLIHLMAKEIVLRNFGAPGANQTLERMVEVLTSLDAGGRRT